MILEDRIYKDYVEALKAGDKHKSVFLSFIRAELKDSAIALKKDKLDDNEAVIALKKQKKRIEESHSLIAQSQRADALAALEAELAILNGYLPRQLDDAELASLVELAIKKIAASAIKDMGRVMKEVLGQAGSSVDSGRLSEIVKAKLTNQ